MSSTNETQLQLPDGRILDMYDSGPSDGRVLVFHHGTPGSRVPMRPLRSAASRLGLRFITTSRPGYGGSTRAPSRTVADVAADTAAVLDAIGADRCLVAGWSGGGPHALACAALLPNRVDAALVIAGVAPYTAEGLDWMAGMGQGNIDEFGASLRGEATLRPYLEHEREQLTSASAEDIVAGMSSILPPVDQAAFTGEVGEDLAANFHEALRVGVDGWLDDDLAFTKPWGFSLADIRVPVVLWQGFEDLMVPFSHGKWQAEHIPGVVAHLEPDEGHISLAMGRAEEMYASLIAAANARS